MDAQELFTPRVVLARRIAFGLGMAVMLGYVLYGWLAQYHEASASGRTSRPTTTRSYER